MNATHYAIVAYAVGLGLLLGYGLVLWLEGRALRRRLRAASQEEAIC